MLKPNPIRLDGVDLAALFAGVAGFKKIGLAVSGGPDSLALLLLVRARWDQSDHAPDVFVYSVDHRLRPEAEAEAAMVAELAGELGFTARVLEWRDAKPQTGIQAKARLARYLLMRDAMAVDDVPVLLTAHHVEDQAETVLMRMAHGSGLAGLGGMGAWSEVEGVRLHRPLLDLRKSQLQEIVTACGLESAADPSNLDTHYERVRWRETLPQLANLGLTAETLGRLARRLQRAELALEHATEEAYAASVSFDSFGIAHLSRQAFGDLPDEIALRVLKLMFPRLGRSAPRLEQLESLLVDLRSSDISGTCVSGVQVQALDRDLIVYAEPGRMQDGEFSIAAGETSIWDGRFEIGNDTDSVLIVRPTGALSRQKAEQFCGQQIAVPMSAVAAAPSVFDAHQERLALGLFTRSEQIKIKLTSN